MHKDSKDHAQYSIHKAIYKSFFSNPQQWRVVDDRRDGTNIIVFQKIKSLEKKNKKISLYKKFRYKIVNIKFYINDYFCENHIYKILLKFYKKLRFWHK